MKNETTLYNHKKLGTSDKPLLKNLQLKQACERIQKGEVDLYEKIKANFTLEAGQKNLLETIYSNQTIKNERGKN